MSPLLQIRHDLFFVDLLTILNFLFVSISIFFNQVLTHLTINLLIGSQFLDDLSVGGQIIEVDPSEVLMPHDIFQ